MCVGYGKVVVYRLGNAHKLYGAVYLFAVVGQLLNSVHRIVAADIEECVYFEFFEYREDLFVRVLVALNIGQFVAAGAEEGRRRSFQQVVIKVVFETLGKIHYIPVE